MRRARQAKGNKVTGYMSNGKGGREARTEEKAKLHSPGQTDRLKANNGERKKKEEAGEKGQEDRHERKRLMEENAGRQGRIENKHGRQYK